MSNSNQTPEVKPGDTVEFTPGPEHRHDKDHRGDRCFHFEHCHAAPNSAHSYKKGDLVENHAELGEWQAREGDAIRTLGGHVIRPTCPKRAWGAVVRAILADGTLALDIPHPRGCYTLHYPSPGLTSGGVPYSATGGSHTWRLAAPQSPQA